MTKIKVCGLRRPEDIEIVNHCKPDYCGFVIDFPKSFRSCSPQQVRELVSGLDRDAVQAVGVFVDSPAGLVAELLNAGTIDIAQLHGNESEDYLAELRSLTAGEVMKAFRVTGPDIIKDAQESRADYILLDQGQGSGKVFDWSLLENAELLQGRRWFLAGGLGPDNLESAVSRLRPYAVDLSSSVETGGIKDREKIKTVIDIVRGMKYD